MRRLKVGKQFVFVVSDYEGEIATHRLASHRARREIRKVKDQRARPSRWVNESVGRKSREFGFAFGELPAELSRQRFERRNAISPAAAGLRDLALERVNLFLQRVALDI